MFDELAEDEGMLPQEPRMAGVVQIPAHINLIHQTFKATIKETIKGIVTHQGMVEAIQVGETFKDAVLVASKAAIPATIVIRINAVQIKVVDLLLLQIIKINNFNKVIMLSRTLERIAPFRNGTKAECLQAECLTAEC